MRDSHPFLCLAIALLNTHTLKHLNTRWQQMRTMPRTHLIGLLQRLMSSLVGGHDDLAIESIKIREKRKIYK